MIFVMGYGFSNCKEDDKYRVLWSVNDYEKEKIKEFDNLTDARKFFEELDETKALVNLSIEHEFEQIIEVYSKKNN